MMPSRWSGPTGDRALEEPQNAGQRKVAFDERGREDRPEADELSAEDVGEELVTDHDGLSGRGTEHPQRPQEREGQRLERIRDDGDPELGADRSDALGEVVGD